MFIGCNYKAYREQHSVSIPTSVIGQSMSKLSIQNVGINGDMTEMSSRVGGSRYSKMTNGFSADDEEDFSPYVDKRFNFISNFIHLYIFKIYVFKIINFSKYKWIPYPIRNAFNEMINIDLLCEPVMMLLCISNILGMIGFYVPFVYIIDLAVEKGMDFSQGTILLSIIGITNTFGNF